MEVKVRSKGDGLYSCSYAAASPLKHTVAVTWGGVSVPNSPFRVSSQSQHHELPVKAGGGVPVVVQSEASVRAEYVKVVTEGSSEPPVQVKKKPLIIITYVEEMHSSSTTLE